MLEQEIIVAWPHGLYPTYVLGWPIYETYVYKILRIYAVLRTATYDEPCMVFHRYERCPGVLG